jgi:hypothetical protein
MSAKILETIYRIANQLDEAGLAKAAAYLDTAADLIIIAQEGQKKSIHVAFSPEKNGVKCSITVHELENPNAMMPPVVFVGKNVDAARLAASKKINELKATYGVASTVEMFQGGLEP